MGLGEALMKFILGFINILFILAGGVMVGFGITAKVDPKAIYDIFAKVLPKSSHEELDEIGINVSDIVNSNATFMIVLGVVILVIAVFGFVGACCMVRWMLVVYAIILIVLLLAQIALIIFAAVYGQDFKKQFQEAMFDTLKQYKEGVRFNETDQKIMLPSKGVELAWDAVQFKERCCGAYNYTDYQRIEWTNPHPSAITPISCCRVKDSVTDLPQSRDDFVNIEGCLAGNTDAIYDGKTENCYDAVKDKIQKFIDEYKYIAIGIAIGICVIELLLIIFAFCLCRIADKENYV